VSDLPGYLVHRGLSALFGLLPEPAVRAVGRATGRALYPVAGRRAATARRHLRRILGPGVPDDVVDAAARELFASYGRYYAELFWYRPRRRREVLARTRVDRLDLVEEAKAVGRGVVFAVAHVGNYDAPGIVAAELGLPLLAVAERLPNPKVTEWFVATRRSLGIEVALTGDPLTRRLLRHLAAGGAIALLADRAVAGRGVEVEFFGEETLLPAGPVALADRTGAPLLAVAPFFAEGPGTEVVVRGPIEIPDDPDRRVRVRRGTQRLARVLEELIGTRPTQWHVLQPNWPSDPGWRGRR